MHIRKEEIMKLKKKSGLISAVIALSCASIVSVGFASWVISQGDTETVNGTISVDTVTQNNYSITLGSGVSGSALSDTIIFGYQPYSGTPNYNWLSNDGKLQGTGADGSALQNLTASFEFTIANITGDKCAAGPAASLAFSDGSGYVVSAELAATGYTTTLGGKENVLAALPTPSLSYSSSASKFTCSVTFAWGTGLNGKNPMEYYKSQEQTDALSQEAYDVLHALEQMNASYTITLTVAKA